jgi:hypothetical protein
VIAAPIAHGPIPRSRILGSVEPVPSDAVTLGTGDCKRVTTCCVWEFKEIAHSKSLSAIRTGWLPGTSFRGAEGGRSRARGREGDGRVW